MAARRTDMRTPIRKSNLDQSAHEVRGKRCSTSVSKLFSDDGASLRARIIGIYVLLIGANVAAWLWALSAFRNYPILLGTAMLAYTFGLRHAFDADHIAAIDNVTRKLMQEGKRPVAVGFFFSLGHSTIVVLLSIAIAVTATALQSKFDELHGRRRRGRHAGVGARFCSPSPSPIFSSSCRSTALFDA